jgi:hypothetical protein
MSARASHSAVIAPNSAVIARLDRATQYAAASRFNRACFGVLDPRFRGDDEIRRGVASRSAVIASHSAVIARLDRATQYAAAPRFDRTCSGTLDPRLRGDDEIRRGVASRSAVIASHSAVIARLDRATQYAAASRFDRTCSEMLDPRFRGDDDL